MADTDALPSARTKNAATRRAGPARAKKTYHTVAHRTKIKTKTRGYDRKNWGGRRPEFLFYFCLKILGALTAKNSRKHRVFFRKFKTVPCKFKIADLFSMIENSSFEFLMSFAAADAAAAANYETGISCRFVRET